MILWHSFPLTGHHVSYEPAHQFLEDVWVDGFFAISGFLITSSWLNKPRAREYLTARSLRLVPGLWCCLIITGFIIAPLSIAIQGGSAASLLKSGAPIGYFLKNSAVLTLQTDVGGSPHNVVFEHQWNGSLWTLQWETLCYIVIVVLGITGLLKRRCVIPAVLLLALVGSALLPPWNTFAEQSLGSHTVVDATAVLSVEAAMAARFIVMFLAGALLFQLRDLIAARWSWVVVNGAIVLLATLLPNYRLIAAVSLAYVVIVSGALVHNPRLRLRTDLSYGVYIYAFPVQQLLIICGLGNLDPIVFAIIASMATLPLAALSWFVVEKPALSLKARLRRNNVARSKRRTVAMRLSSASKSSDQPPDLTPAILSSGP